MPSSPRIAGKGSLLKPYLSCVVVAGDSMLPALAPGDWLVVRRIRRQRRGDVVVVDRPERRVVKRLVRVPGDEIHGRTLGADEWWVEGDMAHVSDDSRVFGPVRRGDIAGRVVLRFWPPRAFGRVH